MLQIKKRYGGRFKIKYESSKIFKRKVIYLIYNFLIYFYELEYSCINNKRLILKVRKSI